MPFLSIIVPVYNVETYLPACLDSILAQTFTDFEILLVDDGSTDGSPALCKGFAYPLLPQEKRRPHVSQTGRVPAGFGSLCRFRGQRRLD